MSAISLFTLNWKYFDSYPLPLPRAFFLHSRSICPHIDIGIWKRVCNNLNGMIDFSEGDVNYYTW